MLSVRLHRKEGGEASFTGGGMVGLSGTRPEGSRTVSAGRLRIPGSAQKEFKRGADALTDHDLKNAQKHFEKAIEIYPEYDLAYNNLGVTLMQSGNDEAGRKNFLKAVELNDHFARAYANLAKISIREKNYAQADEFLRKSLSSDPLNPEALFLATETAYFTRKWNDVIADVQKLHLLKHENYAAGHFLAGKAFEVKSLPRDAIQEYKTFLKEAPENPNASSARERVKLLEKDKGSKR